MKRQIFLLVLAAVLFSGLSYADDHAGRKAVLITGASSGIGRNLAETLAAEGLHVYAGARKEKDLAELDAIDNITAVRLDVTRQADIDAAVEMISANGGLYGLVNNAGVAIFGPVANLADDDLEFQLDVNVDGVVRVTRSFLPLIVASKGRIVTTGSISGTLSSPGLSAYSMSKHAMEAFTDSLAGELAEQGVSVSVVEPGNYKSKIRRSLVARQFEQLQASGGEITDEMQAQYDQTAERELSYKEPDEVSAAFVHALLDEKPLRRYMVVPNEDEARMTIQKVIEELVQLNAWGPYSYDRAELQQMLDEALGTQGASD